MQTTPTLKFTPKHWQDLEKISQLTTSIPIPKRQTHICNKSLMMMMQAKQQRFATTILNSGAHGAGSLQAAQLVSNSWLL
jgi:hypothetical protein